MFGIICLGFALLPFALAQGQEGEYEGIVINGRTLIDGAGASPRLIKAIVIAGNRIKEIVPSGGTVTVPSGYRSISGGGLTMMPGLIDSHIHYRGFDAELYLSHGVTSVVDLGNIAEWVLAQREGIARGKIVGPRLFISGKAIGGSIRSYFVDLKGKSSEDALRAVREMIGYGADVIKVFAEITPPQLEAITREAHRSGIKVIGHIGTGTDAREAAEAGIDALAHLSGVILALAPAAVREKVRNPSSPLSAAGDPLADFPIEHDKLTGLAKLMVEKGIRMEPDMVLRGKALYKRWPQFSFENYELTRKPSLDYIRPSARERWLFESSLSDSLASFTPRSAKEAQTITALFRKRYEYYEEFLKQFIELGGEVIIGTDAQHMVVPGLSYHQELELLVEDIGMSPMQAILSATRNPARFLNQEKDLGTLEVGKLADLILLRGDPSQNIRNIRNVEMVIKDGKIMNTDYHASYRNPLPRPSGETGGVNPIPEITSVTPIIATAGGEEVTVTIEGNKFAPGCSVTFDGRLVPLLSGNRRELIIKLQRTDLMLVGTFPIVVTNPSPEGGPSEPSYFMVNFRF